MALPGVQQPWSIYPVGIWRRRGRRKRTKWRAHWLQTHLAGHQTLLKCILTFLIKYQRQFSVILRHKLVIYTTRNFSLLTRPSLSHSTDTGSVNPGACLLPKFAISAESEEEESSGLAEPSKVSFSVGELPLDEPDVTTPGSTHSEATLSGKTSRQIFRSSSIKP